MADLLRVSEWQQARDHLLKEINGKLKKAKGNPQSIQDVISNLPNLLYGTRFPSWTHDLNGSNLAPPGIPVIVDVLARLTMHPNWDVKEAVLNSLPDIIAAAPNPYRAAGIYTELLRHPYLEVRKDAAEQYSRFKPKNKVYYTPLTVLEMRLRL